MSLISIHPMNGESYPHVGTKSFLVTLTPERLFLQRSDPNFYFLLGGDRSLIKNSQNNLQFHCEMNVGGFFSAGYRNHSFCAPRIRSHFFSSHDLEGAYFDRTNVFHPTDMNFILTFSQSASNYGNIISETSS